MSNEHTEHLKDAINTKMKWKSKSNHFIALKTNSDMIATIIKQIIGKKSSKKIVKPLVRTIHQIMSELEHISPKDA